MAESFRCPSCSAPLEFEGKPVQKCRFCGSSVIVPAHVIQSSSAFGDAGQLDFGDLSALTGKARMVAEIYRLIQNGSKIEAIKVFRETFDVGLKEAKDAVDALADGKSLDLSRMQVRAARPPAIDLRSPQNRDAVKKVGLALGASSLLSFVITFAIGIAVVVGIFLVVYFLIAKPIDETGAPSSAPALPANATANTEAPETSIAQELLRFGGEGVGAGKFTDNRTVAVDREGKIYAADYQGGRIQVFDANGAFLTQIMTDSSRTVNALALDRKGNLFVRQGYDILRVNKETGETVGKYRVDYATDMALGLDGKIYVSKLRGGVTVLSADGAKLKNIQPVKDLGLDYIERIAVDGAGNFFLLDGRNYVIFKLAPDGRLLNRFGGRGTGSLDAMPKTQFYGRPDDLAVDSQGRLYVSQTSRISIFDANGNFLNDFKTKQAYGMAFTDRDELFVAARPFVVKYKVVF